MDENAVVYCFLRSGTGVLLRRKRTAEGSGTTPWRVPTAVLDTDPDSQDLEQIARTRLHAETGIEPAAPTLVRTGDPILARDSETDLDRQIHTFLFDWENRSAESGRRDGERARGDRRDSEAEWCPPTAILRRQCVPGLWAAYDSVRPRVATVRTDGTHGSAWLSIRALEVLRDAAAIAATGEDGNQLQVPESGNGAGRGREHTADEWQSLNSLATALLDARPSMAVVTNRVNRAMSRSRQRTAGGVEGDADGPTPVAAVVERVAHDEIDRALQADEEAAIRVADHLPDRIATLSRSGTVLEAIERRDPAAVLVAESRPGGEGVAVAERLAATGSVCLTTDAAFPAELTVWDAEAVVVGADRILPDGRVVNKVGTRAASLAADNAGIECLVVAARDKIATDTRVEREQRDPAEVYDGPARLSVSNPTFDVTPADAIGAVVTERGVLATDDLAAIVAEHRRAAEWRE